MTHDRCEIFGGGLQAVIDPFGAELVGLRHERGGELLWPGGEAWPRRSPVLFPIVGRLNGDRLRHQGCDYSLGQHGFAHDRRFAWLDRRDSACRLVLEDDEESRAVFPFRFRLELSYALAEGALNVGYRLSNPGDAALLASLGAHPGFRWPLAAGVAESEHRIVFAQDEPEPLRRVEAGGLLGGSRPTPVRGRTLSLNRSNFANGALVFDRLSSRSLRYEAPGLLALEVTWKGFRALGLWAREGGDFLCIEPWRGAADPVGFDGDFADKPGLMRIEPSGAEELSWSVQVTLG